MRLHHGIAACGIETDVWEVILLFHSPCIMALPLAALKPSPTSFMASGTPILHHGIAACGIETSDYQIGDLHNHLHHGIAACGIETSLCHQIGAIMEIQNLHHGIAACGIETAPARFRHD